MKILACLLLAGCATTHEVNLVGPTMQCLAEGKLPYSVMVQGDEVTGVACAPVRLKPDNNS